MESNKSTTHAFITILFSAVLHTALLVIIIGIPVRQFFSSRNPEAIPAQQAEKPLPTRAALSHDLNDIPAPMPATVKKHAAIKKRAPKVKVETAESAPSEAQPSVKSASSTAETPKATASSEDQKPKIIDVDFSKDQKAEEAKTDDKSDDKSKVEDAAQVDDKSEPAQDDSVKESAKQDDDSTAAASDEPATMSDDSAPVSEKSAPAEEETTEKVEAPKPLTDKVAGVQQPADDDAATEATSTDANPPAPDADAPDAD